MSLARSKETEFLESAAKVVKAWDAYLRFDGSDEAKDALLDRHTEMVKVRDGLESEAVEAWRVAISTCPSYAAKTNLERDLLSQKQDTEEALAVVPNEGPDARASIEHAIAECKANWAADKVSLILRGHTEANVRAKQRRVANLRKRLEEWDAKIARIQSALAAIGRNVSDYTRSRLVITKENENELLTRLNVLRECRATTRADLEREEQGL